MGKVTEAKKSYIKEGNLRPTKEELASRMEITVDKLEMLLYTVRTPLSMQRTVWADQDTTFQVGPLNKYDFHPARISFYYIYKLKTVKRKGLN